MTNRVQKKLSELPRTSRRRFLKSSALVAGVTSACSDSSPPLDSKPQTLGVPASAYGQRSEFERSLRQTTPSATPEAGSSRTPLHDSYGILTPSSLHFERHHSGVPRIDPTQHRLLIHGLVDRPLILTLDEIHRLPAVSRIHFIECSGNSGSEWENPRSSAQGSHGMVGGSEWTGVPLSLLLAEVGVRDEARWIVGEGADACKMHRSIPVEKAMDDILVAYGQNGEAIRPEQGYPLRLVVPGWEGNTHIKWLRRIKVVDQPYMSRDETSKYTDLMPDGTARQFTFMMEAKSVITFPSGGNQLAGPGFYEISGLAWSGRGLVKSVGISTDGGETWREAELQEPRHPIALTRFRLPWEWDGGEVTLQSRCIDETGYVQPTRERLIEVRGLNTRYHYNGIMIWKVLADGSVENAYA
ncbi:MAG: sulfite dehydrogenase [Acidobacteriota bacterium]